MRRRARLVQAIYDFASRPWDRLRIVDLGALDGNISIELARHGARVVGIEARQAQVDVARQQIAAHKLTNVEFFQDDVRNLSRAKYGAFDVVLCAGLLYHLNDPDVFTLMARMAEVCTGFAVIDTHIAEGADTTTTHNGRTYSGWTYPEFSKVPTAEQQQNAIWASVGNLNSFWLTVPSLTNALTDAGFSSVYQCHAPGTSDMARDRVTLIACKHPRQNLIAQPLPPEVLFEPVPETPAPLSPAQQLRLPKTT